MKCVTPFDARCNSWVSAGEDTHLDERINALDWPGVTAHLDTHSWAVIKNILDPKQSRAIAGLYADDDTRFRSHVIMARHGFGQGEYRYFSYPLPRIITDLRCMPYVRLSALANRWNEAMGLAVRYPDTHADFITRCHQAGQTRQTPLLLRYGSGDYNCLHQDVYGGHVFPLQVTFLLSQPEQDFAGGEFVLVEQRPRQHSKAMVVPLRLGDGVELCVRHDQWWQSIRQRSADWSRTGRLPAALVCIAITRTTPVQVDGVSEATLDSRRVAIGCSTVLP